VKFEDILARVEACLPKDAAGNFIPELEKSIRTRRAGHRSGSPEPGEALRAEFESSVGKLLPLMERIGQTDKLIDQIVCRLYGLTEEEIKIVEGAVQ
jgi:hypothetical protein